MPYAAADSGTDSNPVGTPQVGIPEQYKAPKFPTETRIGRVRFVRKGAILHFLVADVPGAEFRELLQTEFGAEDLDIGQGLDARIDLARGEHVGAVGPCGNRRCDRTSSRQRSVG